MTERKKLIIIALVSLLYGPIKAALFGGSSYLSWVSICIGVGVYALVIIKNKGYLLGTSIVLWILFGWWFLMIMILLGPITLIIAALLPEKQKCPHCREPIAVEATRCPRCTGLINL